MRFARLAVLASLSLVLLAVSASSDGQPTKSNPRIGFLSFASASNPQPETEPFRRGLRELGYVEGKNVTIEWRFAEGDRTRLPALALELVDLKVDVLVCPGVPGIAALKQATTTIPILMAGAGNPVRRGSS